MAKVSDLRRFKTKRESATGKKFMAFHDELIHCYKETQALVNEMGADYFFPDHKCVRSGISGVSFAEGMDVPPHFKKVKGGNGYYPNRRFKLGREFDKKIKALPVVTGEQLNACAGFGEWPAKKIGVSYTDGAHVFFSLQKDWEYTVPADCDEITEQQYLDMTIRPVMKVEKSVKQ